MTISSAWHVGVFQRNTDTPVETATVARGRGTHDPPQAQAPSRPPLPKGERRVRVDFRLKPDVLKMLDALADEWGKNRTETIEQCIISEWTLGAPKCM